MFDSNCFYQIKFIDIDIINNDKNEYFVTPIQKREISEKKVDKHFSQKRKERLLNVFKEIDKSEKPLETSILSHPEAGSLSYMKLGTKGWFEKFKEALDKYNEEKNNVDDALIAETAISNEIVLVTNERKLIKIVNEVKKGFAITLDEFKLKFISQDHTNH